MDAKRLQSILMISRNKYDLHVFQQLQYARRYLQSVHPRHLDIQKHDIRSKLLCIPKHLGRIRVGTDHLYIASFPDQFVQYI
ncbi:hypothetical protein D3C73_1211470 [compost metagenome]